MPPDSSKKRSRTSVSWVGTTPSAWRPSARYDTACSAPSRPRPESAISHSTIGGNADRAVEAAIDLRAQIADRPRQLVAARRRLAEPEGNRRRRAPGVGDADIAAGHLQDQPRRVAELEDVAGVALDREVLVERADEGVVGIEDDAVVGDLRDGAARGLGEQPGAAAAAHHAVDLVAVQQRGATAAAGGEAVGRPSRSTASNDARSSAAVRPGARHQREQLVLPPVLAGALGDDLLGQHVERSVVADDGVELAASAPPAAAPRTRPGRRATPGRPAPSACPTACGPTARPAAAAWRCGAASRSGRPDRRGRCRCPARATRWRRAP